MQRSKGRAGGIAAICCLVLIVLLAGGAGYEQMGRARDRERLPQIGRSVDIGGRSLNLYCSGEGSPTVIFSGGPPWPGYSWVQIQRETARFTRACWYDRAGYGWSDPGPYPHTANSSAADLHALLRAAGLMPPYVLTGSTFAVMDARVYHHLYPGEVAGFVFVDGVHEDEADHVRESRGRMAPLLPLLGYPRNLASQAANATGLLRLTMRGRAPQPRPRGLAAAEWDTIWGLWWMPKTRTALMQEAIADSCDQVRKTGNLGDLPLIAISTESGPAETELQEELAGLSTRGKHVVVKRGQESIQFDAPETVVEAVRQVASGKK